MLYSLFYEEVVAGSSPYRMGHIILQGAYVTLYPSGGNNARYTGLINLLACLTSIVVIGRQYDAMGIQCLYAASASIHELALV